MIRKITFFTLLTLQWIFVIAQNHVTNGGFETNTGFPSGAAQYYLATGWNNCSGSGSPDYAHTNGTGSATLPNNYFGIVSPHSGNAVMGVILWHSTATSFREYISQPLSTPLVIGNTYSISFYITNGSSSGNYGGYGIDQVSLAFSTVALVQTGSSPINFNPQYVMSSVFFDSTWQQVSFQFTADSAYNFLTFGNFKADGNTVSQFFRTESIQAGYYFVDDIEINDSFNMLPDVALSASDSAFCEKQCIDFYDLSTNNPTSWQWYFPNASPDTSTLQNPVNICYNAYGTFDVSLVACNGAGCDSLVIPDYITVFQNPPQPQITQSNDSLFCSPASTYAWYEASNPTVLLSTDSFYAVTQNGNYYVIINDSNGCGTASSFVLINTGILSVPFSGSWIQIFPNPASDEINLHFPVQFDQGTIEIINLQGEIVFSKSISGFNSLTFGSSNLPDGIYLIRVFKESNQIVKIFSVFK